MRRTLTITASIAIALACGFTAIAALAQTARNDTNVTANVPTFCTISGGSSPSALSTVIAVDALGRVATTPLRFTVPAVVCNTSTVVLATSVRGGVKSDAKAGPLFTNVINYRGTASFGGAQSVINTGTLKSAIGSEAGKAVSTAGPARGNLTITVRPTRTTIPLIAATDYHDTLRITLTPE